MTWFKVDDNLAFHPKVLTAGNSAMGLWVRAGAWSSAQLTDGGIPAAMIVVFGAKKADAERLVAAGLWERTDTGYRFHEWLERNPSSDEVKLGREAMATGSSIGNHRRWHVQRGITDIKCPHCRARTGHPPESGNPSGTGSGT